LPNGWTSNSVLCCDAGVERGAHAAAIHHRHIALPRPALGIGDQVAERPAHTRRHAIGDLGDRAGKDGRGECQDAISEHRDGGVGLDRVGAHVTQFEP
jgi:hypothetical protein